MCKSSGSERNKQTIRQFFDVFSTAGMDAALACLSDDATWWSVSGTQTREQMRGVGHLLAAHLPEGIRFTLGTMTAEADRVAAEVTSHGVLKNGRVYANQYHFLFRLADGKIQSVREHMDSKHALEIWGDLIPAQ